VNFLRFDNPQALWLLLLAGPIVWLGLRSLAAIEPVRRYTAIALRLAVLIVLVLILAGMQTVQRHSDLTVMAVIDQSESVRRFASPPPTPNTAGNDRTINQWLREYLRAAAAGKKPDDRFGVITYDGRPTIVQIPGVVPDFDPAIVPTPMDGTDSTAALRLAMARFPADSGKRLLWISDGNETTGDGLVGMLPIAQEARAAGVRIDVLPIDYRLDGEVMVEGVYAPTESREGQTAPVRIVLRAARPSEGTLYLRHDENVVDLAPGSPGNGAAVRTTDWTLEAQDAPAQDDQVGEVGRYVLVRSIDLPMSTSGANRFEAVFEPAEGSGDVVAANNRAQAFTQVHGRGRVLVLDGVGGESGRILSTALASHDLDVETLPANAFPGSLSQLQRYDAVIFQNIPAEALTPAQMRMLSRYVHDMGGGFAMIGGPNSFGAGGWTNSPIDDILPVACEIPSQTILPSGALVIVIDRSGSMSATVGGTNLTQQEVANEASIYALATLFPDDLVGVIAFDQTAKQVVPLTRNSNPGAIASQIRKIQPGGGTNIHSGLDAAYNVLAPLTPNEAAVKHVILLTDGHSTSGDYIGLMRKYVEAGISLSAVGIGDGMNNPLLHQLSQMAGGQFYPIADPRTLPQIFIKEARTVRKNLIREQPFEPQIVQTGSPIMASVTAVPMLQGLVLTGEKRKLGVFQPIVGPEGEPVFAHWQVGLGRSAAFTSDATNRWASDWLRWGGYRDFWARTVRAIARPGSSTEYDLVAGIEGDQLRVRLDVAGRQGHQGFMDVRGSLLKPDGSTEPITLTQTGPGMYEAAAPADATGSYIVSLFVSDPQGGERRTVFGGTSKPPGAELRRFQSNRALLEEVARITGGRVLDPSSPTEARLYERDVPFESRSIRPLWRPLLWLLLVLFLLDVACRRIAWDAGAIARWVAGAIVIGSARREREARTTLDALRKGAAKRRDAQDQPPTPVVVSSRKFEAAPGAVASADFAAAVGAAAASPSRSPGSAAVNQDAPAQTADEGPTTSRLLAAKRRVQQRIDDNPPGD
jgi:Ca-activated chloride channel family protein